MLLVDDVHWADAPSLRFLVYLAGRLEGLAATVIASVRTGDSGSDPELVGGLEASPGAHVVAPAALSDAGVGSVLAAAFGQVPDAGFARACMQATGGNPLFVREVAAALIADGIEPTAECERADLGSSAAGDRAVHARPSGPTVARRRRAGARDRRARR